MDKGTYVAASAGLLQMRKLEVVSNNLANSNTPGFKRELLVGKLQTFDETLAKQIARRILSRVPITSACLPLCMYVRLPTSRRNH